MSTPHYQPKKIEKKWQKKWLSSGIYKAKDFDTKPSFYSLIEFPYPSGDGLHVGHIRSNTAMDIISRKRRMEGFNVLYPIGWDAFGLPTENYAIKTGIHPTIVTKRNTNNFRKQLQALGFSFDWSREINTTDPSYYKWTQWLFLQFFKHGLAYRAKMLINWCPKDKIGLANEEVIDGKCERCGTAVEKRQKEQWMLAITKYADRLYSDLDTVDYLEKIKLAQRNWIGRSQGAEIEFEIIETIGKTNEAQSDGLKIFTTRPDTLFGVTYVVISPEHPILNQLNKKISNWNEVGAYIDNAEKISDIDRTAVDKPKTGVEIEGVKVVHPITGKQLPIWVADYVLASYGTGAVMAVPAHDERDFSFAKKYNLPIVNVIEPLFIQRDGPDAIRNIPFAERRAIVAIVKHWQENKYICLRWKKVDWKGFIVGGIESGESPEQTASREITEETGYKNSRFVKSLGGTVHAQFFQTLKNQNRFAHFEPLYFELIDGERQETDQKEKDLHDILWLSADEIEKTINREDQRYMWNLFVQGQKAYTGTGILVNSSYKSHAFNGKYSEDAKKEIVEAVQGMTVIYYKLRDWIFSRQRYWGEPIPVVHCSKCGIVPLPESDLPVTLPKVKKYQPTDTGESPLASIEKWLKTVCPQCKGPARRETDTMPNWAGSSWYYMRYADPKNKKDFADKEKLKYWLPVDWYNGGMEHATLHLLYSRFWHKFFFDIGLVPTTEPYAKRTAHGLILAEDGEKMSKSRGNVVNPDSLIKLYGADTLRLYEMFMGPFDQAISWNTASMIGVRRFLDKAYRIAVILNQNAKSKTAKNKIKEDSEAQNTMESLKNLKQLTHKTIKKVTEDIESMRFNTAVSSMMILLNGFEEAVTKFVLQDKSQVKILFIDFLKLLAPFAPHITEEIWTMFKNKGSIHQAEWPHFDSALLVTEIVTMVVQINGKVRSTFKTTPDASDKVITEQVLNLPEVIKWLEGRVVKRTIIIKSKLISIVTS